MPLFAINFIEVGGEEDSVEVLDVLDAVDFKDFVLQDPEKIITTH